MLAHTGIEGTPVDTGLLFDQVYISWPETRARAVAMTSSSDDGFDYV